MPPPLSPPAAAAASAGAPSDRDTSVPGTPGICSSASSFFGSFCIGFCKRKKFFAKPGGDGGFARPHAPLPLFFLFFVKEGS
jgi:hypothetical protein